MKKKKTSATTTRMAQLETVFPDHIDLDDPQLYINRELGMLEFQRRVLDEAMDTTNPLLERVKFLAILGSNLEEFFMVRVGGLIMQRDEGVPDQSIDGLTAPEQLVEIRKVVQKLMEEGRELWNKTLMPELDAAGIHIRSHKNLTQRQRQIVDAYFHEMVYPVLTPLAFDPGHPFPHISNLSLNLAILLEGRDGQTLFARIKVPDTLPQLVPVKRSSGGLRKDGTVPYHHYFVWLSDVISANIDSLFPGLKVLEVHPFHVIRNADMEIQELEASDLLETMEESVRKRRFGVVVRLAIRKDMPDFLKNILVSNMKVDRNDVYTIDSPMVLSSLMQLARIERQKLKDRPFTPITPAALRFDEESPEDAIYTAIRAGDILLHHPYDSFSPVVEFLRTAARDPNVLAIKQTLYRTGSNSPVVKSLLEARRDYGKQVAVLVELKARFDEESNIGWARMLEQEGVHVTYGLLGLKTHSKIALVVRKEGEHIRRYVHLGTGNYNHVTAQLYEDLGMFTCDDQIGADATDLFNYLTGYSFKADYCKLLVAPINLRQRFEEMILREIEIARSGAPAHLIFKMNSLVDQPMIQLLYLASQCGVRVDLITRGICCLRPGIQGLSENIRVISILGRFLEHSRIYYFHNNGNEEIYMGSADLMPRNLNQRVEVLFPVEDRAMINHIRTNILQPYMEDNTKARIMKPDGTYNRLHPEKDQEAVNVQTLFLSRRKKGNWG
ncbi:MAG TPA: polyphosphate kinase 1 [Bellilinea sp.]